MLDVTRSSAHAEAITEAFEDVARRARPEKMVEEGAVFAATTMMTPFAMAQEATMFMRRVRGLNMQYFAAISKAKSPAEVIDANMKYGERALGLTFGEFGRVLERSALMGRRAAAPDTLPLRDLDKD